MDSSVTPNKSTSYNMQYHLSGQGTYRGCGNQLAMF